ncbi:MAG TPA: ABC transporter substrate-binding protein, partial [Opitutaceae bacterium]|nr:ABC transporter substrate-binding protein [Opitutaceae bacterium]
MTARGKFVLTLLILGIASLGAYKWWDRLKPGASPTVAETQDAATVPSLDPADFVAPINSCPLLPPAGTYVARDNILDLELSEYAGYAGIIVANGGLEPSENSVFFRKHGFKVRIKLSEEESWPALNTGHLAASATTVDVLAAYCRNFQVTVPVQIGFSRGADGLVVRKDIRRINDLKGKILVTSQFTEADFFLRYLTQEAGLAVHMLDSPSEKADPEKVNLLFTLDAFAAGDAFLKDLQSGSGRLAGCVTWAPKTTEVVEASEGAAVLLTTNKNLLIIADVLVVNKGFAQANPAQVAGLVEGVLEGNRLVRDNPTAHLDTIARAFKWDREETREELAKVHLSNLPENIAFYSGAIDAAGSFSGIFSSAILVYGSLIDQPTDADRYMVLQHLEALQAAGAFAGQTVSLAPIRSTSGGALEGDPLLSKDIRFLFEPNSAKLDLSNQENLSNLDSIKRLLQVSPGSTILLRGHVDNALVEKFREQGGDTFVRQMA